jgi:hypothetical protein
MTKMDDFCTDSASRNILRRLQNFIRRLATFNVKLDAEIVLPSFLTSFEGKI